MQKGSLIHRCPGKRLPRQELCKTSCDFVKEKGFSCFGRMSLPSRKYISIPPCPFSHPQKKGDAHATSVCTRLPTKKQEVLQKYPKVFICQGTACPKMLTLLCFLWHVFAFCAAAASSLARGYPVRREARG